VSICFCRCYHRRRIPIALRYPIIITLFACHLPNPPSVVDFLALHRVFMATQLRLSQNSTASPLCAVWWSTQLAGSLYSPALQSSHSHHGCPLSHLLDSLCHSALYIWRYGEVYSLVWPRLCSLQYMPFSVCMLGHPGLAHGLCRTLTPLPLPHQPCMV